MTAYTPLDARFLPAFGGHAPVSTIREHVQRGRYCQVVSPLLITDQLLDLLLAVSTGIQGSLGNPRIGLSLTRQTFAARLVSARG